MSNIIIGTVANNATNVTPTNLASGALFTGVTLPYVATINSRGTSLKTFIAVDNALGDVGDIQTQPETITQIGNTYTKLGSTVTSNTVDYNVYLQDTATTVPQPFTLLIVGSDGNRNIAGGTGILFNTSGTDSIFGSKNLQIAPANFYVVDRTNLSNRRLLGLTTSAQLVIETTKQELMGNQYGTGAFNKIVTGQNITLSMELKQSTLENWQEIYPQIGTESAGQAITSAGFSSALGAGDRENAVRIEAIKIIDGVESTNGLDKLTCFLAAPTGNTTIPFTIDGEQLIAVEWTLYADQNNLGRNGLGQTNMPLYYKIGV